VRYRHRWEDGNKMDLKEIGYVDIGWMHLLQERDHTLNTVFELLRLVTHRFLLFSQNLSFSFS
jgi:hypothetical protein